MPGIVVIVPAFGRPQLLERCLSALNTANVDSSDIMVVDDASHGTGVSQVATRFNARLIRLPVNVGPAAARNAGVLAATDASILFFVDSDVLVAPDVLHHLEYAFADASVAAVFGCYDAEPAETDLVSAYVNLRHREIHRLSAGPADTFWAGCGAVRREAFEAVGGFDPSRRWNFIEDVEFGRRLDRAGQAIRLDPDLQGKHLKRWTLASVARTDAMFRARPWVRLMLGETRVMRGLNADRGGRASMVAIAVIPPLLLLGLIWPASLLLAGAALSTIPLLNRRLFASFVRLRGRGFAVCCVPLHAFHLGCVAVGLALGVCDHLVDRVGRSGRGLENPPRQRLRRPVLRSRTPFARISGRAAPART